MLPKSPVRARICAPHKNLLDMSEQAHKIGFVAAHNADMTNF